MFIQTDVIPFMKNYNCHAWRVKYLWNEECDEVLKTRMDIVQGLYKKFYRQYRNLAGQNVRAMLVDDFLELFGGSGLMSEQCAPRDISVCFNLAMMTQVNELESERAR